MVLIITNTQDLTSDFIVKEINRRKIPFARLNTDEFPNMAIGNAYYSNGLTKITMKWENRKKFLDFDKVTSVLYRRPIFPIPNPQIDDEAIRHFCIDECYEFLRGIWLSLDCFWMSHPESIRKAEHKLVQLKLAKKIGFIIPETLISNDPVEVTYFYRNLNKKMVIKPLYMGFVNYPGNPRNIYTSQVLEEDMKAIEDVRCTPSIFQEKIEKDFDVRVTVIGDKIFPVKIFTTKALPKHMPDWRCIPYQNLRYSIYTLPADVKEKCIELVNKLNLEFGAIDLAVDKEGNHVFFEINPNGQWAWLEESVGLPLSYEIVNRLISGGEKAI